MSRSRRHVDAIIQRESERRRSRAAGRAPVDLGRQQREGEAHQLPTVREQLIAAGLLEPSPDDPEDAE